MKNNAGAHMFNCDPTPNKTSEIEDDSVPLQFLLGGRYNYYMAQQDVDYNTQVCNMKYFALDKLL